MKTRTLSSVVVFTGMAGAIIVGCGGAGVSGQGISESSAKQDTNKVCGTVSPSPAEMAAIESRLVHVREAGPTSTVTIPVYVHVITDDLGNGAVSDATITEQIAILNGAFAGQQSPGGYNTSFRFQLVGTDRTANTGWFNSVRHDANELAMKGALRQGTADDLNIYIRNPEGVGGYSAFPWNSGNLLEDGVTMDTGCLPGGSASGYNLGDVAVHEAGHWLGLYHTYQGGCTTTNDYVSDTPAAAAANFSCPAGPIDTCTGTKMKGNDPVMNFMDSTVNSCIYQFTSGQNSRMNTMWTTWRKGK